MERDELCGRSLGEFVLRERIGEGGFGAVYRCEQPLLGREAVVKVLHRKLRTSETALQRFLREARLASRLDHPYAAHVYAFGVEKEDSLIWIAMEMVHGTPLDAWLKKRRRMPLEQLVPFFERIAEVVQTAHEKGIVHRDLKPQNVMVIERAGRLLPKLLDLGIARLIDDDAGRSPPEPIGVGNTLDAQADPHAGTLATGKPPSQIDTLPPAEDTIAQTPLVARLTQAGAAIGSPPYMAPEQWEDAWTAGPRADLYSLGILAYEALTGRRPFESQTVHGYMAQHVMTPVPVLGEGFAPALDRFFARALAKRPEDRPESALELAASLRVASGLGEESLAIAKLDEGIRDAWIADGPQPIAEAVAALDGARNPRQARDAAWDLVHGVIRYVMLLALAARAQVRDAADDPALADLLRALRRRDLPDVDRLQLIRLLIRPFASRGAAYPIPELVELAGTGGDEPDAIDKLLALHTSSGLTDDQVRAHLAQVLPGISRLLRRLAFLLDYPLVVPRAGGVERWTGLRRARRSLVALRDYAPTALEPMVVDGSGQVCLLLAPLARVVAPTLGAEDELFVFDGRGRHGARMVAAPAGFEHHDATLWDWLAEHVVVHDDALSTSFDDENPPYLGLQSFTAKDADRFVGREREIDAFVNRLRGQPLQIVVGASGAGKSSFVHAGVVPALPADWRVIAMRPGASPISGLAARLASAGVSTTDLETSPAAAVASIGEHTLVVVVDQLEELFTLCSSESQRARFLAMLAQLAASADAPIRVICTVRDDFLMRVEALGPLRGRISAALVLLGNPAREDLVRTVIEPARRVGYELAEPELAVQMVEEVADRPGALALLSFTASRLWELRDRRFRQLTRQAYDAIGGVAGALGKHADATFTALAGDDQRLARELFRHLVTSEGTRAVLSTGELRQILASPRADAVIESLVAARLIVVGDAEGESRVEIIHEALITVWPRLQQWVREDAEGSRMRDQLRAAARQWEERDRPKGLLWRDDVLAELERWRRSRSIALTDAETAFAEASRHEALRTKRARRTLVVVAFAVLAAALVVLVRLNREAGRQRELADLRATEVASMANDAKHKLAEQSLEQGRLAVLAKRSGAALLYLTAALEEGAPRDAAVDFMQGDALRAFEGQRRTLRGHRGSVLAIDVVDGDRVVSAGEDGALRIWKLATGELVTTIETPVAVGDVRVDPTRTRIAAAGADGRVRLVSFDGKLQHTLQGRESVQDTLRPAFSPDGQHLATVHGSERVVRIWNTSSGVLERTFDVGAAGQRYYSRQVAWSPRGDAIVVVVLGLGAELRDAATGKLRARLAHDDVITSVAFSPDGAFVATASFDRSARVWDTRTGALHGRPLEGHGETVETVAFDPKNRYVITGSRDLTARLWDIQTGRLVSVLDGHSGAVRQARFDPSGKHIVTASEDGVIDVWEATGGRHLGHLEGHAERITGLVFADDDLVTSGKDGSVRTWRFDQLGTRTVEACAMPTTFALARDDSFLVAGCADGTASIVSLGDGRARLLGSPGPGILTAGILADGRIVTFAEDQTVRVWRADGSPDLEHPLAAVHPSALAVSANGRSVYAGVDRELVELGASGERRASWVSGAVEYLDVSPDGQRVACISSGGFDAYSAGKRYLHLDEQPRAIAFSARGELAVAVGDTIRRWDGKGSPLESLRASGSIAVVRYDASGERMAAADANGVIVVWGPQGTPTILEGHLGRVIDVAFDPRGLLVSIGIDNTLRVWDPATSRLVASHKSHRGVVYELHMASDGSTAFAVDDGSIIAHSLRSTPVDAGRVRAVTECLPLTLREGRVVRRPITARCR